MKKLFFLISIIFFNNCLAQTDSKPIKNISYYSASFNRVVSEFKITTDSLFIIDKPAQFINKSKYEIADEEIKGEYYIIYIKSPPYRSVNSHPNTPSSPLIVHYGMFVLGFSKDKNKLFVLREGNVFYPSLEDAKKVYANTPFENKYFFTWHSKPMFETFTQYPDIKTASKSTIQKVLDDLLTELNKDNDKRENTDKVVMHGGEFLLDNFSRVLINNHLSPVASIIDLSNKLTEYNIARPPQIPGAHIVIDSPIGN